MKFIISTILASVLAMTTPMTAFALRGGDRANDERNLGRSAKKGGHRLQRNLARSSNERKLTSKGRDGATYTGIDGVSYSFALISAFHCAKHVRF